jgi:hypothetical protein
MRLIKASNEKTKITLSKKEWQQIGRTAGWIKTSQNGTQEMAGLQQMISGVVDTGIGAIQVAINKLNGTLELIKKLDSNADFQSALSTQIYSIAKETGASITTTSKAIADLNRLLLDVNSPDNKFRNTTLPSKLKSYIDVMNKHLKSTNDISTKNKNIYNIYRKYSFPGNIFNPGDVSKKQNVKNNPKTNSTLITGYNSIVGAQLKLLSDLRNDMESLKQVAYQNMVPQDYQKTQLRKPQGTPSGQTQQTQQPQRNNQKPAQQEQELSLTRPKGMPTNRNQEPELSITRPK